MTVPFVLSRGLIRVDVELEGPTGAAFFQLVLDTGATNSMVSSSRLAVTGYDLTKAPPSVRVTTGSGTILVPRLTVMRIKALGQERTAFPILAHTWPPSSLIEGVLGLDFLLGQELTINFRTGTIDLK